MGTPCLLLTPAQAAQVRGPSAPGAALEPCLLADGVTLVLPAAVLDDPAHAAWQDLLSALPQTMVAPEDWTDSGLPA